VTEAPADETALLRFTSLPAPARRFLRERAAAD
jgi:hypothetical protein